MTSACCLHSFVMRKVRSCVQIVDRLHAPHRKHHVLYCGVCYRRNVFTAPLPNNGRMYSFHYSSFQPSCHYHGIIRISVCTYVYREGLSLQALNVSLIRACWCVFLFHLEINYKLYIHFMVLRLKDNFILRKRRCWHITSNLWMNFEHSGNHK
jgi:hypothetical protein